MDFRILGRLEAVVQGAVVPLEGSKQRALLAVLLLHANEPVSTSRLAHELWGDDPPRAAAKTLQMHVSRLRRALTGAGVDAVAVLVTHEHSYELRIDPEQLDARRFERLVAAGRACLAARRPRDAASTLHAALSLWRGPALADLADAPFAQAEVARLEELRVDALEALMEAELELGRHADVIGELERLVAEHPYRERFHAQLMLALYRSDRQVDALRAYREARRLLVEEVGVEPGDRLRALEMAVLAQDPSLDLATPSEHAVGAPTASPSPAPPPQRTSFVGRVTELDEVLGLLADRRVVTLTGPGGTGKTRLAQQVAARFDGWSCWIDLAELVEPDLVAPAIASALRVPLEGADPVPATLAWLTGKELLLVLDNFERLTAAAASIGALVDGAPGLRVLVTSRVPLHLEAEHEYAVQPLALPGRSAASPLEIASAPAVQLFVDRAAAVRTGFELTAANAAAVAEICVRLDGLPLAIELAASRVKIMGPETLLARLDRRLALLTARSIDVPSRHRTLRGTIAWSYELLDDASQRCFAALAVFAGGCTLDSVEAVCRDHVGDAEDGRGCTDLLPILEVLVDHSLLRRDETDRGDRYRMLDTVGEFADECLCTHPNEAALRRRHAHHFLELAEAAAPELERVDGAAWLIALRQEHDNLRAALAWLSSSGDAASAVRMTTALWRFWLREGHLGEGRAAVERVLALPETRAREDLLGEALTTLGNLAYWQRDYDTMVHVYEEALAVATRSGNRAAVAQALLNMSFVATAQGDIAGSEALHEQALVAAVEAGADDIVAEVCLSIGHRELFRSNPEGAIEPLERAIRVRRETGHMRLAEALLGMASAKLVLGDADACRELVHEARRLSVAMDHPQTVAATLFLEAKLANAAGDAMAGARLAAAWRRWRDELRCGPPDFVVPLFGDPAEQALATLGEDDFALARAAGERLTLEDAAELADRWSTASVAPLTGRR